MKTYNGIEVKHLSDKVYALNIRNGEVAPQLVINVTLNVTSEQEKNCKYFSSAEERTIWLRNRNNLIDYVLGFYGEGEIYSEFFTPVLTRDEVMFACNAIDKVGYVNEHTGSYHIDEADTFSRELIRDYIFCCRGKENVEWELAKVWFERNVSQKVIEHDWLVPAVVVM